MTKKRVIESLVSGDAATKRWKATFATARMAYESGELKDAERLMARAVESAHELPEKSFAVPAAEIALAAVMLAQGRIKEAESRLASQLNKLQGGATADEKELLAVALRFHAECLIQNGDERQAEKELLQSIELCEHLGSDGIIQLAYSLCDLCGVYLTQGRIPQAEQRITKAMAILGNTLGPESPEYVRADMIYAVVTPMTEQSRLATVEDGIQRMEYGYGKKHPNIARVLNRYLQTLETRGEKERLQEAKERFASALK